MGWLLVSKVKVVPLTNLRWWDFLQEYLKELMIEGTRMYEFLQDANPMHKRLRR